MSNFLSLLAALAFLAGIICTGGWLFALLKRNPKKPWAVKIGICCVIFFVAAATGMKLDQIEWDKLSPEEKAAILEQKRLDKLAKEEKIITKEIAEKGQTATITDNENNDFSNEQKNFVNLKELVQNKYVNIEMVKGSTFSTSFFKQTLKNTDYYYYGELKDGRPHGKGIKYDQIASIYIGNFSDGKMNGFGTEYAVTSINKNNGDLGIYKVYEGYFKDNEYSGKGNRYTVVYNKDGKINLKEIIAKVNLQSVCINNDFLIADKKFYDLTEFLPVGKMTGSFANNRGNGKVKQYKIDTLIYEGDVEDDRYHGKGTVYRENGTIKYEGTWKNGQPHGEGISYYDNGNTQYKGGMKNGKYHGEGILYNPDGSVKYKGNWANGDIA